MELRSEVYSPPIGDPDWLRMQEPGVRVYRETVLFQPPFAKYAPSFVSLGLTAFDVDNGTNARLQVEAVNIKKESFDLVIRKWADTKVYSVSVDWLACANT